MGMTTIKFTLDPTRGALIPELTKRAIDKTAVNIVDAVSRWLAESAIPLTSELALVWGIICFAAACTGSARWFERGAKSVILSIALKVVSVIAI